MVLLVNFGFYHDDITPTDPSSPFLSVPLMWCYVVYSVFFFGRNAFHETIYSIYLSIGWQ